MEPPDKVMNFFDENGNPISILRSEFQTKVIPYNIEKYWDDKNNLRNFAVNLINEGFYKESYDVSKRLLELFEHDEGSEVFFGVCLLMLEKWNEAEKHFTKIIKTFPKSGVSFTNLAKSLMGQGKKEEAISELIKGLKLDPNQENGLEWFFYEMTEEKKEEELIRTLKELSEIKGAFLPDFYLGLFYLENDLNESLDFFRKSVQASPENISLLQMISSELIVKNHLQEAVDLVMPYLNLKSPIPFLTINIAFALAQLGDINKALEFLNTQAQFIAPQFKNLLNDAITRINEFK
ncbi:MAG: hypothetical protein PHV06_04990 [bacterium]|nr:hypothetical protein [bacterium]